MRASPCAKLGRLLAGALLLFAPATGFADVAIPDGPHVDIRGSLAIGAVARAVAEKYMGDHPEAVVTVSGGGTHRGLKSLILGTADMALGTDVIPDDIAKMANDAHVTLKGHPVFSDAVVVVVSPDNPIQDISLRDLRDIFRGKIVRWADVGDRPVTVTHAVLPIALPVAKAGSGDRRTKNKVKQTNPPDAGSGLAEAPDIEVLTFAGSSGPYETFKKELLGDEYVITPTAREVTFAGLQQTMTDKAIGYTTLHGIGRLKALPIDGVLGSADTVRAGRYPLARQLSIYVREPASKTVADVVDYFLSKDIGQRIAAELGDVPAR